MNLLVKTCGVAGSLLLLAGAAVSAQAPGQTAPGPVLHGPLPKKGIERVGPNLVRVGNVFVDTQAREVSISGRVNDVPLLEWVANTIDGMKAYESAMTADTDAVTFNTALLMIGLDPAHGRAPAEHFDKNAPQGDPVEIWVEWKAGADTRRVHVEELLLDRRTSTTMPEGPWVYTGSTFLKDTNQYLAQLDGVLIGFVHSPAPIIENPRAGSVGAWGAIVLNKAVITPGTLVTLIVKALPQKGSR